jgi:hypothetical protein
MDNGFLADGKNIPERQLIPIAWTPDPGRQYHFGSLRDMSTTCTATATLQTWLSPARPLFLSPSGDIAPQAVSHIQYGGSKRQPAHWIGKDSTLSVLKSAGRHGVAALTSLSTSTTAVHTVLWSIKPITAARVGTRALRRCGRWSTALALAAAGWVVARVPALARPPVPSTVVRVKPCGPKTIRPY